MQQQEEMAGFEAANYDVLVTAGHRTADALVANSASLAVDDEVEMAIADFSDMDRFTLFEQVNIGDSHYYQSQDHWTG